MKSVFTPHVILLPFTGFWSGQFSLHDVKAQLAHASIQSTERYAKLTPERMRVRQGGSD